VKPQVLYACLKVGDTPLMIALTNPTKSDKKDFIENSIESLANIDPETIERFNQKIKVTGNFSATLETETKDLNNKDK
jgi:hypothetical protein